MSGRPMRWDHDLLRRKRAREMEEPGGTEKDIQSAVGVHFASRKQRRALANIATMLRARGMQRLAERFEAAHQSRVLLVADVVRLFALANVASVLDDRRKVAK